MDPHQKVLLCGGAPTHQCRRHGRCGSTRSWNLLQQGECELIQASCINWSPNGGDGTKFRDSQPVSLVLQDKAWCAWHGATETLGVFPFSPGTACGSGQVTEFVAQWFDTVWQILLVPSAGCSVPVVCEHWQNLLAGKGGDLESSRSLIFQSVATQSCKRWFHQRLHITWFMALKLVSTGLRIKGRKSFFSKCS